MAIYVLPVDSTSLIGPRVVEAAMPEIGRCPVLTRLKALVVDQGSVPLVEHVFRDRASGRPLDLSAYFDSPADSSSGSSSSSDGLVDPAVPAGVLALRIREASGLSSCRPWTVYGEAVAAAQGRVSAMLTAEITARAGIYEASWAVVNGGGRPIFVDRSFLCVERSLFGPDNVVLRRNLGPPGLQELRMQMMDSSENENLLLQDIEFKDDQLLLALLEPVRYWNEQPPPGRRFTTSTYPFRGAWSSAVVGQLHRMAAAHYRRNYLTGQQISDKHKEMEYLAEADRRWQEYRAFVAAKKLELNLPQMIDHIDSVYMDADGWGGAWGWG